METAGKLHNLFIGGICESSEFRVAIEKGFATLKSEGLLYFTSAEVRYA